MKRISVSASSEVIKRFTAQRTVAATKWPLNPSFYPTTKGCQTRPTDSRYGNKKGLRERKPLICMVAMAGLEPATPAL